MFVHVGLNMGKVSLSLVVVVNSEELWLNFKNDKLDQLKDFCYFNKAKTWRSDSNPG